MNGAADSAPARSPVAIALINDHRLSRQGMRRLLEGLDSHFFVSGEAADEAEAIELFRTHTPDVVLIDLTSRENGSMASAVLAIKTVSPKLHVIVIAPIDSPSEVVRVIRAGANGYLTRSSSLDDVVRAVEVVAAGGSWIDPHLTPVVMEQYRRLSWPDAGFPTESTDLSHRDREFLRLLAAGQNNRQISESTGLAESTVKNNLSTLFRKLGVRDRTQAVLFAIEHGIVAPGGETRP
jgi:DNA-binding NarL/FixJ family response regulator